MADTDSIQAVVAVNTLSGFKISTLVAGLVGAAIHLRFSDDLTRWSRLVSVASGMALAQYFAPPIVSYLKVPEYVEAVAVLVGLFGLSIAAAIFRELKKLDIAGVFASRYGRKTDLPPNDGA